jgi:hypothetical protein
MSSKHPPKPEPLDLTEFSRPGMRTSIYLKDWRGTTEWVRCGQVELVTQNNDRDITIVNVRGPQGWTDFEHDSIKVLSFDLVGTRIAGFWGGTLFASGYLRPGTPPDFHFPTKKWLDEVNASATWCSHCKGKERHKMVEYYVPKNNQEEYERVRDFQIEIRSTIVTEYEGPGD